MTVAALALWASAPAWADEIDCAHAMVQQDMNICADRDYQKADGELNRAYKAAIAEQDGDGQKLLREAQRDWIKFRDAECAYEAAPNQGGSIYPMEYSGCLTGLTKARTRQIKGGQP
jgi:uncharacterized protein YecT (DUF1311 family)